LPVRSETALEHVFMISFFLEPRSTLVVNSNDGMALFVSFYGFCSCNFFCFSFLREVFFFMQENEDSGFARHKFDKFDPSRLARY
jgi:hypothetical protein